MSQAAKLFVIFLVLVIVTASCALCAITLFDDTDEDNFLKVSSWCSAQHGMGTEPYWKCLTDNGQ